MQLFHLKIISDKTKLQILQMNVYFGGRKLGQVPVRGPDNVDYVVRYIQNLLGNRPIGDYNVRMVLNDGSEIPSYVFQHPMYSFRTFKADEDKLQGGSIHLEFTEEPAKLHGTSSPIGALPVGTNTVAPIINEAEFIGPEQIEEDGRVDYQGLLMSLVDAPIHIFKHFYERGQRDRYNFLVQDLLWDANQIDTINFLVEQGAIISPDLIEYKERIGQAGTAAYLREILRRRGGR